MMSTTSTELAVAHEGVSLALQAEGLNMNPFASASNFEIAKMMVSYLSRSSMVPEAFQYEKYGEKAEANCMIAMEMAARMRIGLLECFQNISVIYGRPSFSATFMIARLNTSGLIVGGVRWKIVKDKAGSVKGLAAFAKDARTGEINTGQTISLEMAKRARWYDRQNSHWPYMPEQMMRYRSATFFIRAFYPSVLLGMHTKDELLDSGPTVIDATNDLNAGLTGDRSDRNPVEVSDFEPIPGAGDDVVEVIDVTQPDGEPFQEATRGDADEKKEADAKKTEAAAARKAAAEAKKQEEQERAALESRKRDVLELFKQHFGTFDKALAEIVQALKGKSDVKTWTQEDVDTLHARLREMRAAASRKAAQEPPPFEDFAAAAEPTISDADDAEAESAAFL